MRCARHRRSPPRPFRDGDGKPPPPPAGDRRGSSGSGRSRYAWMLRGRQVEPGAIVSFPMPLRNRKCVLPQRPCGLKHALTRLRDGLYCEAKTCFDGKYTPMETARRDVKNGGRKLDGSRRNHRTDRDDRLWLHRPRHAAAHRAALQVRQVPHGGHRPARRQQGHLPRRMARASASRSDTQELPELLEAAADRRRRPGLLRQPVGRYLLARH